MNDDHFTETLTTMLAEPPRPHNKADNHEWIADVRHTLQRRRRARNILVGSAAAAVVAAGIVIPTVLVTSNGGAQLSSQHAAGPGRPADTPTSVLDQATIVNAIMYAAAKMGDATPTSIQYVNGTRGALVSSSSGGDELSPGDGAAPSVLVQATGNFTMETKGLPGPDGTANATGTAIYLVIDQSGQVTDKGITKTPVDLVSLGQVFHPAVPKATK